MSHEQRFLEALIAAAKLGFQQATSNNISERLNHFEPSSGTAMRDAAALGVLKMLLLQGIFCNSILAGKYNFVHVVLTDGEDGSSKISERDLIDNYSALSQKIPKELLRNIFIGIGVDYRYRQSLERIAKSANGEYYQSDDDDIEQIFAKITLNLKLQERAILIANEQAAIGIRQRKVTVEAQRNSYLIMFTIDKSGSMSSGNRWGKVKNAVRNFISQLTDEDLVSAIVFDDECTCITDPDYQRPRPPPPPPPPPKPVPQVTYTAPQVNYTNSHSASQPLIQSVTTNSVRAPPKKKATCNDICSLILLILRTLVLLLITGGLVYYELYQIWDSHECSVDEYGNVPPIYSSQYNVTLQYKILFGCVGVNYLLYVIAFLLILCKCSKYQGKQTFKCAIFLDVLLCGWCMFLIFWDFSKDCGGWYSSFEKIDRDWQYYDVYGYYIAVGLGLFYVLQVVLLILIWFIRCCCTQKN